MMMNNDAYDKSFRLYSQTECGLPMSVDLDKHWTDQTTAKRSVRGGSNNSVSLSVFDKG